MTIFLEYFCNCFSNHESWRVTSNFFIMKFFCGSWFFKRYSLPPKVRESWVHQKAKVFTHDSRLTLHFLLLDMRLKRTSLRITLRWSESHQDFPKTCESWVKNYGFWWTHDSRSFGDPLDFFMIFLFMFSWLTIIFANFLQK